MDGSGESDIVPETVAYKDVEGLSIFADVYRDPMWAERPVVVYVHGGALIMGNRGEVPRWLLDACRAERWVLVSIDYRLAPETKLPAIIEDLDDAFAWVGAAGSRFGADPRRIGVTGGSAGGYLSLTAGFRVLPRMSAVVSCWGYGDLIGDWYTQPSPHPCHHEVAVRADEANRQVSGPQIADDRDRQGNGWLFYQYCRQHGVWSSVVSGWEPSREADRFRQFMPIANVTADFPPTLLIHGELDTDVPYSESVSLAAAFVEHGVEHRLISVRGAEHGLDGADPATIDAIYGEAVAFLRAHFGPN
jgi:acetyl esterase/lipase